MLIGLSQGMSKLLIELRQRYELGRTFKPLQRNFWVSKFRQKAAKAENYSEDKNTEKQELSFCRCQDEGLKECRHLLFYPLHMVLFLYPRSKVYFS